jgi:cell division protein ZapA
MPEVEVDIGGKSFSVSCQVGEEQYLVSAAAELNLEADKLGDQINKLSESRMLLMAGLMLADKTAGAQDKLAQAEASLSEAMTEISRLKSLPAGASERVEVEVVPAELTKSLAEIASKAEALADQINV